MSFSPATRRLKVPRSRFIRWGMTLIALVLASAMTAWPAQGAFPSVKIEAVNGQSVDGKLKKTKSDTLLVSGSAEAVEPAVGLIADAGDSSFVRVGESATLSGLAFFGTPPYSFSWSFAGSNERFSSSQAQTTAFDTSGLSAGPITVALTVTDSDGASATDTVRLLLWDATSVETLVNETVEVGVGVPEEIIDFEFGQRKFSGSVDGQTRHFPFEVEKGAFQISLLLNWQDAGNDFDLVVDDPSGANDDNAAAATGNKPERLSIQRPAEGDWTASVLPFLNTPDTYNLLVTMEAPPVNPLPRVTTQGPFRFEVGEVQNLSAQISGGTAPVTTAWDLNGDGIFETPGTEATTSFPLGIHFVTVKSTDSEGFEVRETTVVRVVTPGSTEGLSPIVVIAVTDTGINPYHKEFSAATYSDSGVLELTENFTRHPSEYIPGYPATSDALPVTLGQGYRPPQDAALWTKNQIPLFKMFWIPGTKIIGATDRSDVAAVNAAPDATPLLDDDGHGTAAASVAVGNTFGFCPACLLVFTEGLSEGWVYKQSWIDLASNSFGALANVGFVGVLDPTFPKTAAERGQISLYAAGNGVDGAFIVPEQTYTSDTLGPDWAVRVGAAERSTRKPILGTGKPVDIASWGAGLIPAAGRNSESGTVNFSGTSAATPYSAGVFGSVLRSVRESLHDRGVGQRTTSDGVIATGRAIEGSPYLSDGVLTRAELTETVFKTAEHDGGSSFAILPTTTPNNPGQFLVEGYGILEPASGLRAVDVLLGNAALPERPNEDSFFAADEALRDAIWGDWNGGGGGSSSSPESSGGSNPFAGATKDQVTNLTATLNMMAAKMGPFLPNALTEAAEAQTSGSSVSYWLHHKGGCVDNADPGPFMDNVNSTGDDDFCGAIGGAGLVGGEIESFTSSVTSEVNIPAESDLDGIVYLTTDHPAQLTLTATLLAGGRVIGQATSETIIGNGLGDIFLTEEGFVPIPIEFTTEQALAIGETLTLSLNLETTASWYFGYEGGHASFFTIAVSDNGGGGTGPLGATITSPDPGTVVDPAKTPILAVAGTASFPAPPAEQQRFFLRRNTCSTAANDNLHLSTQDGADGGNTCALAAQPLTTTGLVTLTENYPALGADLPLTLGSGAQVQGTVYVDGHAVASDQVLVSPLHQITVELGTVISGSPQVIGRQTVAASAVNLLGLPDGPIPFGFSFPVPQQYQGLTLDNLTFTVVIESSQGFSYTELDSPPSFVDIPVAGSSASERVEVSVDDDSFAAPIVAALSEDGTTWGTTIDTTQLADGDHQIYARAVSGESASDPDVLSIRVERAPVDDGTRVEVQIVTPGAAPSDSGWVQAVDVSSAGDWSSWVGQIPLSGKASYDVYARLVINGSQVAIDGPVTISTQAK